MKNLERRFVRGATVRAKQGDKPGIEGHAAVFDQEYDTGWYIETIKPGAFSRAIKEKQDVRCLFNHDANQILGRTKASTLAISEDKEGLFYSCDTPDTQNARDVRTSIDRGDIDGCSFAFVARKTVWRDIKGDDGKMTYYRDIEDVDLYDVGPVTYPAYTETNVGLRSMFPEGIPAEIRTHVPGVESVIYITEAPPARRAEKCECKCAECKAGKCADCSSDSCVDVNCEHGDRSLVVTAEETDRLRAQIAAVQT